MARCGLRPGRAKATPLQRRSARTDRNRRLFFQEGADSGFFGHGNKIAGPEAGVYVGFSCPGSCGGAGDVYLLQDEDSLLAGLELGGTDPSHVAGERKAEDDFVSFEFWPFEDGLDLQHGFMPAGAVFGGAVTRDGGLGNGPGMHVGDAPSDHIIRGGYQALKIVVADFRGRLYDGLLGSFYRCRRSSGGRAGRGVVAEFLDGNAGAEDPALSIERCLRSFREGGGIFDLDGDGVAFLEGDGGGLLQNGVDANDNGLRRFRDSGKSRGSDLADGAYKRDAGLFGEGGRIVGCLRQRRRREQARPQDAGKKKPRNMHTSLLPRLDGASALHGSTGML